MMYKRVSAAVVLAAVSIGVALVSCSDSPTTMPGDLSAVIDDLGSRDLGQSADAGPDLAVADAARPLLDLASTDLAGLFNCKGVAICNPTMDFCLTYYDGSQAVPGKTVNSPACFAPTDTCTNQGQNMDCGCIQNDDSLGVNCQGSCVDNLDGTFTCYAK